MSDLQRLLESDERLGFSIDTLKRITSEIESINIAHPCDECRIGCLLLYKAIIHCRLEKRMPQEINNKEKTVKSLSECQIRFNKAMEMWNHISPPPPCPLVNNQIDEGWCGLKKKVLKIASYNYDELINISDDRRIKKYFPDIFSQADSIYEKLKSQVDDPILRGIYTIFDELD